MRACMLAYSFYDSDNRVRRYAEALVRRGDQVDAIALGQKGQSRTEVIEGVRVIRLQRRTRDEKGPVSYLLKLLMFFLRSAWFLTWQQGREPYDVIHVHNLPDFEVFATLVPRLMGARVILDMHEIVPEFYQSKFHIGERSLIFRLLVLVEKLSIAYANHVLVINGMVEEIVLARGSVLPEKCTTIINYPDTRIFHRRGPVPRSGSEFVMCYPGTLSRHQGVDVAVEAVALARERVPGLRFLIIGDGPERENLKQLVRDRKLENCVTFKGMMPLEQVAEIMSGINLGVVPKRKEGFGNIAFSTKIMEFMATGVPVLASRTRIDEYYFNDRLVEFFESGDARDLAARIVYLIEQPERLEELRHNATRFIASNNWDERQHEYFTVLDHLAQNQQTAELRGVL